MSVTLPIYQGQWSKSGLSNFDGQGCSWKFMLRKIVGLEEPEAPWSLAGRAFHHALEMHERRRIIQCRGDKVGYQPTPWSTHQLWVVAHAYIEEHIDSISDEVWAKHEMQPEDVTGAVRAALENWYGGVCQERLLSYRPLAVEPGFTTPMGSRGLHGFIDWLGYDHEEKMFVVVDFKGLATETPILTTDGWSTMGKVAVGDYVFGSNGKPCKVTAKSEVHYNPCYRITFGDGSSLVADHEHRWTVNLPHNKVGTYTTEELVGMLYYPNGRKRPISINNVAPLDYPNAKTHDGLPIDPYVLGAWLGDGDSNSGRITSQDEDIWLEIKRRGYELGGDSSGADRTEARTIYGIRGHLVSLGILGNKRIPDEYLTASLEARLDLLRGLMDTDGTWNKVRGEAAYVSRLGRFEDQVYQLILSLGFKAYKGDYIANGFGHWVPATQIKFRPHTFNPFLMERKAAGAEKYLHGMVRQTRRPIRSIKPVPTVPTVCISVDAEDQLYLAGKQMILTHNTANGWGAWAGPDGHELEAAAYAYASLFAKTLPGYMPIRMEWHVVRKSRGQRSNFEGSRVIRLDIRPDHFDLLRTAVGRADEVADTSAYYPNPDWFLCSEKWCGFWDQCQGGQGTLGSWKGVLAHLKDAE